FIVALGLLLMFVAALWLLIYFIFLPKNLLKNFTSNRSRKSFAKGLLALSEGKWKNAEKLLLTSTKNSPTPELGYMAAARAAIAQNKIEQAFSYLDEAENSTDNPLTVDLTRCELWIKTGKNKQAINLLNRILKSYPNNPRALHLLTQATQNAGHWQRLEEILPKVQRLEVMQEHKVKQLTQHSIVEQLNQAQSASELQSIWKRLNKKQKLELNTIQAFAENGLKLGIYDEVAKVAEQTLNKNFNTDLLEIWARLPVENHEKIKIGEKWLKKQPENAQLLKILGKLCLENKLWGKAKGYLEKSLNLEPSAQTFKLMARYFDTQGESENALEAYRQAEGTSNQLIVIDNNKVIDKTPEQDN
ncbi:MAG TPA: tetratricopeptide repeat protein, partial [Oceanospirillales bacterium]|nr:tetratricopeptide repeat protein [Oceanospirillales bacterium]